MNIVIFGASGFIGRHLTREMSLTLPGASVICLSSKEIDVSKKITGPTAKDAIIVNLSCSSPKQGGGILNEEYISNMIAVNTVGAANVAEWAVRVGAAYLVHCSSLSVFGRPWPTPLNETSSPRISGSHVPYSGSKLFGEDLVTEICNKNNLNFCIPRLATVYGPHMKDNVVSTFIKRVMKNEDLEINDVGLNLIYVKDVASAITRILIQRIHGILHLASPTETYLSDLLHVIKALTRSSSKISIASVNHNFRSVVDTTLSISHLGVYTRLLEVGLRETICEY